MNWKSLKEKKPMSGYPVVVRKGNFVFFANFKNGEWHDIVDWTGKQDEIPSLFREYPAEWIMIKELAKDSV